MPGIRKEILSVMGPHAGEDEDLIFSRKQADIKGPERRTFWVFRSYKAKPDLVRRICQEDDEVWVTFVEAASKEGAKPTRRCDKAVSFSPDRVDWHALSENIGPVTGKIDRAAYALVLDKLDWPVAREYIDLRDFAELPDMERPVLFARGSSTICVCSKEMREHPKCPRTYRRRVLARGRMTPPFAVWLETRSAGEMAELVRRDSQTLDTVEPQFDYGPLRPPVRLPKAPLLPAKSRTSEPRDMKTRHRSAEHAGSPLKNTVRQRHEEQARYYMMSGMYPSGIMGDLLSVFKQRPNQWLDMGQIVVALRERGRAVERAYDGCNAWVNEGLLVRTADRPILYQFKTDPNEEVRP
jgi:hypothetical protein